MKYIATLALSCFLVQVASASFLKDAVHREKIQDFETVWLEDSTFPTFRLVVTFADGSLSDKESEAGLTNGTLSLLTAGSPKYKQEEILEFLDFYGANFSGEATHEYATLSLSGLVKDIPELMGMMCHLVKEANYPEAELKNHRGRAVAALQNLTASPASLAERVFRQVSLAGTLYQAPNEGTLSSIKQLTSEKFKARLGVLRDQTFKRIYIMGPKQAYKQIEEQVTKCGFVQGTKPEARRSPISNQYANKIILIPLKGNQAQIRIGRFIGASESRDPKGHYEIASSFLGGGFTSKLVQEVRVKRGLTYSVGAVAALQRDYGRAIISTFSKNETVDDTVLLIRDILKTTGEKLTPEELEHVKSYIIGHWPFSFESGESFLSKIVGVDHQGYSLDQLYRFPEHVKNVTAKEVSATIEKLFGWDKQIIVIVGDPSLEKELAKIRPVMIVPHKKFL